MWLVLSAPEDVRQAVFESETHKSTPAGSISMRGAVPLKVPPPPRASSTHTAGGGTHTHTVSQRTNADLAGLLSINGAPEQLVLVIVAVHCSHWARWAHWTLLLTCFSVALMTVGAVTAGAAAVGCAAFVLLIRPLHTSIHSNASKVQTKHNTRQVAILDDCWMMAG
jgi:hypothetical protein